MKTEREPALGRVLIVDDEELLLDALCDTLRDHRYYTVGFTSANEALTFLSRNPFDLVLSDLNMPEMNGISLLQQAAKIDQDIVGIIMTGQGSINSAVEAMKAGALDYILKPFKLNTILPVLSRAMSMRALKKENIRLNQDLMNRTDELEEVVKDLEAFSSYVSHDLKGPLGFINNFAKIVLGEHQDGLSAPAEKYVSKIKEYSEQMEELIDDLLAFSKSGKEALNLSEIDMQGLVNTILRQLQASTTKYKVEIKTLNKAHGDEHLISQVFLNLISNAIKYSAKKENPVIEIGSTLNKNHVTYYVKDNGAGFKAEQSDLLFEAFKRVHSESDFEGTGIGLAIAKRIVNRHNGNIWAEGEVGKGATFYFNLPENHRPT